jgi:hypothetical protein
MGDFKESDRVESDSGLSMNLYALACGESEQQSLLPFHKHIDSDIGEQTESTCDSLTPASNRLELPKEEVDDIILRCVCDGKGL